MKTNSFSRSLRMSAIKRDTHRLKVILAPGWHDFEINRGIAAYAHEAKWILNDYMLHTGEEPPGWRADGIIALLNQNATATLLRLVRSATIPVVDLANEFPDVPAVRVLHDNRAIGRLGAEHLLAQGFKRLAYYRAFSSQVEAERLEGFRNTVEYSGKELHLLDLSRGRGIKRADRRIEILARQVRKLPLPIGIMAQFDGSAIEVYLACETAGISVPEQVALVGVDNDPITSELGPIPLTSVDSDRFRLGYEGARRLDALMRKEEGIESEFRLPPKGIVIRQSSDIQAVSDLRVAQALIYIQERAHEGIQCDDVAENAGLSKRRLHELFVQHLGKGVNAEITRMRIETAKKMLARTDHKTLAVALDAGFTNRIHFCRSFKQITGMTPSEYRRNHRES